MKYEYPEDTVHRTLDKIGVTCRVRNFVGVFPVKFPRHAFKRYDISLCYKVEWVAGEPKADAELWKFSWVYNFRPACFVCIETIPRKFCSAPSLPRCVL